MAELLANSGRCCTGDVSSTRGGSTLVATARLVAVWTLEGSAAVMLLMALMVAAWFQISAGPSSHPSFSELLDCPTSQYLLQPPQDFSCVRVVANCFFFFH